MEDPLARTPLVDKLSWFKVWKSLTFGSCIGELRKDKLN